MIAGVCGGIGEYLDVDPIVIRLIWIVATVLSIGAGILAYLITWVVIPREGSGEPAGAPAENPVHKGE
ncbi:MAG: PspC domain-containing protein [Methanomicrobiales archaeon]|nr:PspC domain-containing protein [Methanomicrobiales archaeon]